MYMFEPLLFAGNIFFWSIMPLLEKGAIRKTSHIDMSLLRYILAGTFTLIIYFFYKDMNQLFKYDKYVYSNHFNSTAS